MFSILPIGLLGLAAGMLVNYLADVLPIRRRPGVPICPHCGAEQSVAPYLLWPRRCTACGRARGPRTWLVEIAYAALFVWLWQSPAAATFFPFWAGALLWVFFGVVAVIDLEHRLILHPLSYTGLVLGGALGAWLHGAGNALAGGLAGYGIMLVLFGLGMVFTRLTRRMQGDEDEPALGFGDVNLSGVLGLLLGWPNVLLGLVISVMVAGVFSLFFLLGSLALRRYRAFTAIPYGPFLIAGAAVLLFLPGAGQRLLSIIGPLFWISP